MSSWSKFWTAAPWTSGTRATRVQNWCFAKRQASRAVPPHAPTLGRYSLLLSSKQRPSLGGHGVQPQPVMAQTPAGGIFSAEVYHAAALLGSRSWSDFQSLP